MDYAAGEWYSQWSSLESSLLGQFDGWTEHTLRIQTGGVSLSVISSL